MLTRMILSTLVGLGWTLSAHATTKRYLVTFKTQTAFHQVAQSFKGGVSVMGSQTAQAIGNAAMDVKVLDKIGMLAITADSANIVQLENSADVARIEEEQFFPAPKPIGTFGDLAPASFRKATQMERPWGIDAVKAPEAWNVTKGQGVKVMVIDTGLDKTHPAIASRFVEGKSFMGGDETNFADDIGHGTHVSGTILADGANGGLVGVAPEADLYMAKVCGSLGCSTVAISQAVNWAVEKGVQVVNMSLGGPFMTYAEQQAYDAAEAAGVMIVAASGNDGKQKVSYPAAYTSNLAVGAVDSTLTKAEFSNWGPELDVVAPGVEVLSSVPQGTGRTSEVGINFGTGLETLKSTSFQGSAAIKVSGKPLVYAALGKPEDFSGKDLRGKVALIARGELLFADKAKNALAAGAEGIVIFNNAPGLIQGAITADGSELPIPVVMIEQTAGEKARDLLAAGKEVTTDMGVVPSDYASFQGTSMASPHAAGVAALVRGANPALTPAQVREIMKETATALTPNDQNQMGAGLVNAEAAVQRAQETNFLGRVAGF